MLKIKKIHTVKEINNAFGGLISRLDIHKGKNISELEDSSVGTPQTKKKKRKGEKIFLKE